MGRFKIGKDEGLDMWTFSQKSSSRQCPLQFGCKSICSSSNKIVITLILPRKCLLLNVLPASNFKVLQSHSKLVKYCSRVKQLGF